jgi:hypothetical protein
MRTAHGERGQILPFVGMALAVLLGFAAFAVDVGYLRYQQRLQQTAADSAALGAAWALISATNTTDAQCGLSGQTGAPSAACTAGQLAAKNNGFNSPTDCTSSSSVCVTLNYPPASGGYQGNTSAIEAIVTATHQGFFSQFVGSPTNNVTTRAVALFHGGSSGPCIYAMTGNIQFNAGAQITAPCGILVHGHLTGNGGSNIQVPSIGAVNGPINCGGCATGTVEATGIQPFADPCPTVAGCAAITASYPVGSTPTASPYFSSCTTSVTIQTQLTNGCYSSWNSSGTVNLAPGLYVITGNFSANVLTCTACTSGTNGQGVTLVIGGRVNLNGTSTSLIAPPPYEGAGQATVTPSGGVPGVLIYQTGAANCTSPENFSGQVLEGMLYAPTCHINLNAGSTLTVGMVVAGEIVANGIILSVPGGGGPNGSELPTLAE